MYFFAEHNCFHLFLESSLEGLNVSRKSRYIISFIIAQPLQIMSVHSLFLVHVAQKTTSL